MKKVILLFLFLIAFLFGCKSSILDDPSTMIQYSVPQYSHVKLIVENSYKTIIAILVDENLAAGTYDVSFNMSDLSEGIYFYSIELKGINNNYYSKVTKLMLLVK